MNIARGGWSWILFSFFLTVIFFITNFLIHSLYQRISLLLFFLFLLCTVILIIFFRDPERSVGHGLVAVADGKIREISQGTDRDIGDYTKISTFMNLHNVHVNRMPLTGKILSIRHIAGSHLPAFAKESERNERVIILLHSQIGTIRLIQIAGTIARRIVPYLKKGETYEKGDRIGLIRMGSRVDLYIPTKKIKSLNISLHQRIKAGEDSLAEIND